MLNVCQHLWVNNQIGDDSMFLQVGVSFLSFPILNFIGTI